MKTRLALLLLITSLIISLAALCSCDSEPPAPPPEVTASFLAPASPLESGTAGFTTPEGTPAALSVSDITYTETFILSDNLKLEAAARYPKTGFTAIDTYYDSALESFKQSARTISEEFRDDLYSGTYVIEESYDILRNDGLVLSIHRIVYDFFGGAHPNHYDKCDNFSAADGRLLTLDDIFTVSPDVYLPRLQEVFEEYINKTGRELFDVNVMQKIRENFPHDTFCITGTESEFLQFYFSPYRIASYAAGTIVISVPYDSISDILQENLKPI